MEALKFVDSHVHMAEPGFGDGYTDLGSAEILMTCTAKPDEWRLQEEVNDARAVKSYGVHPWYAEAWNTESRDALTELLEKGCHVGEIGLDSKRGTVAGQMGAFTEQMEIAAEHDRIATVHMIGTEKEVLDTLRGMHGRCPRVILHSYGSDSYLKPFSELGCRFSISPRILSRSDVRVSRLMSKIPEDSLLLETDAPNSGRGFEGMVPFAERLAGITGTDTETLLETAAGNLRELIG